MVGILLLTPLLAVLIGIYHFAGGRSPRSARQVRYDRISMTVSALLTLLAIVVSQQLAPPARGPIWPHVYAALGGFFTMLATLGVFWYLRPRE